MTAYTGFTDFNNFNDNVQSINITPTTLVDQVSDTEFYIGTSSSFMVGSAPVWSIKRICQDVTIWMTEYPNGDQGFNYVWDCRLGYTYS